MKTFVLLMALAITAGKSAWAAGLSGTAQPLTSIQVFSYDDSENKVIREWQVSPQTVHLDLWDNGRVLTLSNSSAIPMCGHSIGQLVNDLTIEVTDGATHTQKTLTIPQKSTVFDLCDDKEVLKIIQFEAPTTINVK